ncbi:MAG TPA: porin family protein [Ohtaekwangia sp.]|nr:porin family protein [Ohtaekwangia sp.]
MKIKAIIVIALFFPTIGFGQIWHAGIKAGVALSNFRNPTSWTEGIHTGYSFGATAYKQIRSNFGLGFEFQYQQKGYNHVLCETITDKLHAEYLEVPIMADYVFLIPGVKNLKGHVNAGGYAAYWLKGRYEMTGFGETEESFDFERSSARRFDFGPVAGGRLEWVRNHGSFSLDFRYAHGVSDMIKNKSDDTSRNTNRTFIVGLSYMRILNFL